MKEEISRWIKQAKEDFETARYLFEGKKYKQASFFCQQSCEKALKSELLKKENKIPKIHDLVVLANKLRIPEPMKRALERITNVYVDTRYPDTVTKDYTKEEVEEDLKDTEEILKWLKIKT